MKQIHHITLLVVLVALSASSCAEQDFQNDRNIGVPIQIAADYSTTTRVTDAGFADGDRTGIFITDYVDGRPQPIGVNGNRANNVLFTYHENENRWQGATTIYWKDNQTPVDVVGYYPFDEELEAVDRYEFSVQTRQDALATQAEKGGYEGSDLLWAKNVQVAPTKDVIRLMYNHLMAGVTIRLIEGKGFEQGEWAESVKQVWIPNTVPVALVDLEKGSVVPGEGDPVSIVPFPYNNDYRAVVVPQVVDAGQTLIGLTVDGINYELSKDEDLTYTSGKMHTFSITVDKRSDTGEYIFTPGEESVTAWIDDSDFHDGLVREYITVEVETPGSLAQCMEKKGLDARRISSLKVQGMVNWTDLQWMGDCMPALTYLNLYDVRIDDENDENDDVITGFSSKVDQTLHQLTRVILPRTLRGIGDQAFYRTSLSGTLEIPEGVTFIGYGAFIDCPFNAELKLPSTLKRIEADAFAWSSKFGELHLPEGLEYIGGGAFNGGKFQGTLVLPQSLKDLGTGAFADCGFSGDLVIPQGVTLGERVFVGNNFSHVEIPEGYETLPSQFFDGVPLLGELQLPASMEVLDYACLRGTKISSVVLPDKLKRIEAEAFAYCQRLQGTITLPQGVDIIPEGTFMQCDMLSGVHLSENLVFIGKNAFKNCYNLNSIVCDALTPPVVEEGAFDGVPKDNFSVEVPAEAVSAYKMADGWKEFKRITAYSSFICRPASACALNTPHEEALTLNAEGAWHIIHQPDWCELSPSSGMGKTTIRLSIDALAHGAPSRRDSVVFALEGTDYSTYCTVQQRDYEYDENELVILQEHKKGRGVDILFLGDGYDADALAEGQYMDLVREEMEYFFAVPPFDRLRDYFNVYAAVALSQEQGINTVNTYRNTRFGTIYGGTVASPGNSCKVGAGARLFPMDNLIFPYITDELTDSPFNEEKLRRTLVILVPNTSEYDGISYLYDDGRAISICPRSEQAYPSDTRGVVQREAGGFGFGKLANEMVLRNAFAPKGVADVILAAQQRGWYQNVSITGKMAEVPWAHFIFDPRYSDYVDIFEGGFEYTRNIFRSEASSCLNTGIPYYNAISRQVITMRIMEYAGESFSMDDFYANDTNAWGPTGQTTRSIAPDDYPVGTPTGFTNPVVVTSKFIPNKPKRKNK